MNSKYIFIGGAVLLISAGNFAAGFYTAKKVLEPKYVEIAEQEIEDAKEYYSRLYKKEEFSNPVEMVASKEHKIIVDTMRYTSEEINVVEEEDFELEDLTSEIETCKKHGHPYIIKQHDYLSNDKDYTQISLTYFEDDDVLVDAEDTLIEDVGETVGLEQLNRFGMWSGDNNIVYVRNDAKQVDFEVIRNKGNYARDVLGFIEHSSEPKVRKFRRDDE